MKEFSKTSPKTKCHPGGFDPGRRSALQKIGRVATAVAAPMIVPASVLAQATKKTEEPPPSERINLALIGLGDAMESHMRLLLPRDETFVRFICDVDSRRLAPNKTKVERSYRKAANYTGCQTTQDYREAITHPDVDAVVIATPTHWNAAISLEAIRAGKDVLCQAPSSLTVAEGRLVADAADQYGAIFQVVTPLRCEGGMRAACELVRNGYIGEVKEIYARVGSFEEEPATPTQSVPEELDYDRWLGPAPWAPYHSSRVASGVSGWVRHWDYGDRKHGTVGFGLYDIIQWALGRENSGPIEFVPRGVGGEAFPTFRYKDGPVVRLDHPIEAEKDLQFVGTQGDLMVSDRGRLDADPGDLTSVKLSPGDLNLPEMNTSEVAWIDCVRTRRKPVADATVAQGSSNICHLAALAERLGRPIKWDPAKEEIIGDAGAARLLDRPRRAPYTLI